MELRDTLGSLGLTAECTHSRQTAEGFVARNPDWTDYLIIDPDLPEGDGSQFILDMLKGMPGVTVAVMLDRINERCSLEMVYYGAVFVPKPLGSRDTQMLIRVLERQSNSFNGVTQFAHRHRLSALETRVLDAQLSGLPDKMIASALNTSEHAVNQTIRRIHRKLGASSFREVVSRWRRDFDAMGRLPPR